MFRFKDTQACTSRGRESYLVLILFATLFMASVDNQLLIPLLPLLTGEFSESIGTLGLLFSVYALAAAVFNLLLGPLTDRFGRVSFLLAGLLLFAVLAALTSRTESFEQLLLCRAVTGVAAGLLSTCTAGFVGDYFAYERRGRIMGIVLSSYFAALIVGIPLSAWVAENLGWRRVFLGVSVCAAALLFGAFLVLPRGMSQREGKTRGFWSAYAQLAGRRATAGALWVSFGVSGGTLAFYTFISGYLNRAYQLTAVAISTVFLVAGVAALIASPLSGWLSDRWGKRRVFLLANSLLVVPLVLLMKAEWGLALFSVLFMISLCIAFRQTALQTIQTELTSLEFRGSYLALRNCFSQLGISLSVYVAGILYGLHDFAGVIVLASGLTIFGTVAFYFFVTEPGS